jgi:hypothetical protein
MPRYIRDEGYRSMELGSRVHGSIRLRNVPSWSREISEDGETWTKVERFGSYEASRAHVRVVWL